MTSPFQSPADKWAWVAFALAVLVGCLGVAHRVAISPRGRVILPDSRAPWIMAHRPFSAAIRQLGREEPRVTHFAHDFDLANAVSATSGRLEVRAFGGLQLRLNEQPVPLDESGTNWKRRQVIDVREWLRVGQNRLRVTIQQRHGPALLSLRLDAGERTIVSNTEWRARSDPGPEHAARIARDIQQHPDARRFPSPSEAIVKRGLPILGLFALFFLVFLAFAGSVGWLGELGRGRWSGVLKRRGAALALGSAALAWLFLFATKFLPLAPHYGFDATKHIAYVDLLRSTARLPLATDGWSTYHPPLFHALAALAISIGRAFGEGGPLFAEKLPSVLAGFGLVWLSLRLARRLFPGEVATAVWATAFAACLPMNLYMAAYFSNEALAAFLTACALVAGSESLLAAQPRSRDLLLTSIGLGLALLTKYTAVVIAPPLVLFVGTRCVVTARQRAGAGHGAASPALSRLALLILPMLAIAGWFYLRNALLYGDPLIGNWNLPGSGRSWWSPPGFHTPEYYTSFGEALTRPYYAAFASFWDSLYSTLWGDGQLAGKISADNRNPQWHYGWMTAGYAGALPVSGVAIIGCASLLRSTLRSPHAARRCAIGLLLVCGCALGFALFFVTLSLPFYGQAKAFYALSLTPLLALAFARGTRDGVGLVARLPGGRWLAAGLQAALATALALFFLGFAA